MELLFIREPDTSRTSREISSLLSLQQTNAEGLQIPSQNGSANVKGSAVRRNCYSRDAGSNNSGDAEDC